MSLNFQIVKQRVKVFESLRLFLPELQKLIILSTPDFSFKTDAATLKFTVMTFMFQVSKNARQICTGQKREKSRKNASS